LPDMRFAPPSAMRVVDHGGGLNQTSVRTYNERLVMSLLRHNDGLSRMQICQISGLSAQTVSVIVRSLERDNLLIAGSAQRGRVGPPSIPMFLNPEGAYSIGIKIGRRTTDTMLIDFVGGVRQQARLSYNHPSSHDILTHIGEALAVIQRTLSSEHRNRVVGIGISLPDDVESWPANRDAGSEGKIWSEIDFEAEIGRNCDLPVYLQNDVTAAASAELLFGSARELNDFAYFYIGCRSAARIVLNHHVYAGRKKKADPDKGILSLSELETSLAEHKLETSPLWDSPTQWPDYGQTLDDWTLSAAQSLVIAVGNLTAFVEINRVIIDGSMPTELCLKLAQRIQTGLEKAALAQPGDAFVLTGKTGPFSKALGAASLPLYSRFMVEQVGLTAG